MLYFAMEIDFGIELISILTCQIGWVKNRVRFPSITVPICPISLKTTLFGLHFRCLKILVRFPLGWSWLGLRVKVGIFSCTDPILWLNRIRVTIQAG